MLAGLLAVLPWIALGVFMAFGIREPRPLPPPPDGGHGTRAERDETAPAVSIIVPARNEAHNIEACVASLTRLRGVDFEIIVVDDRSTDGTAELVRAMAPGNARELRVLAGWEVPDGWFGKPWVCRQGADVARGHLLLFTDADTVHHPELLLRALAALREDRADALSVLGRQEMGTFGEKLVQPQIFVLIGLRFRRLDRVLDASRWREAIANGQFILVRKEAYDALGGHGAVRGEVVEDLRLAQELTRTGHRLAVRQGEDVFSTRMYESMRDLVNGWTKNVAVGARQSAGRWGPVAAPGILLFLLVFWLLPPAGVLLAGAEGLGVAGPLPPGLTSWAIGASALSVLIWISAYGRFGAPPAMGLLYPLGAAVAAFIVARSWLRGRRRIEWKGRTYGTGVTEGGPSGAKASSRRKR